MPNAFRATPPRLGEMTVPSPLSLLFAGFALTSVLLFSGPAQSVDDPAAGLQETVLANGLTVLTLEDHSTPVVSFQMWVRAGSRDETFYTGIAHLFEHMMFKGSKRVAPEEHARLVGSRGGRINAYTSRDVTVYHEDVTAESLPLVLALEAERVQNLDISEHTLESEREVVLEERRMRTEDRPGGVAFEALAALAWQAHPYRWPVIGWRADIEAVTVEACRSFFETYYSANNIVLVIVGDIDTTETLARVKDEFGGVRRAESIPRNPGKVVAQRGERRSTVHYPVRIPLLYAGWHAPKAGAPDGDALDVASQILSAGRSSRLYRKLVHENQQALYAEGGYWAMGEAGLFFAVAGVRPGVEIDDVESEFFAQIDRMAREPASEAELAKAKRILEVGLVEGLSTTHSLASRIGDDYVLLGRVRSLDERLAAIQAVTAEDVMRVVSDYLGQENRSVVQVISPPASEDQTSDDETAGPAEGEE
ncbi:MAG: pitrilysin family protein [Myxococcota bacterium]|nr:pitrilysin family protein [Myxococcota bacterium]